MPFALGRKVLGAERQRNGGWGSETSVFLSVESPQHLGAGTREEQQRWGGGGFGRRADSSGCVGSREGSRGSVRPLGSTGVLTRAQEGRSRLKRGRELPGGQGQDRPSGQPGGGAQSQPEAALGAQEVWGYRGINSKAGAGSWTGTGSPGALRDQGASRLPGAGAVKAAGRERGAQGSRCLISWL